MPVRAPPRRHLAPKEHLELVAPCLHVLHHDTVSPLEGASSMTQQISVPGTITIRLSHCRETGQRLGLCRCAACRPDLSYLYSAATNTAPLAGASS